MSWQLSELRDRLRTVLGLPSTANVPSSTLDSYINQVLRYTLPMRLNPPALRCFFSIETIGGRSTYGVDADMLSVLGPVYLDNQPIRHTFDDVWFFSFAADRENDEQAAPTVVLFASDAMYTYPVPDDVYEIRAIALARPDKLENDTDQIAHPSWGLPTVYGAALEYAQDRGDTQLAATVNEMFVYSLSNARREELLHYNERRAIPGY